ncbi:MAG: S9 family peptidase [Gemmatimonadota bacterium]|nr:S9 family peptidase [Gemmatimonadota bacterium]
MRHSRSLLPVLALLATTVACSTGSDSMADGEAYAVPSDFTQYTIEQFLGTTSVFGSSFSPDGSKILVSSDESGIFNAYSVPVDGSPPEPLTESETDAVMASSYFPDDERFIYGSDQGGNELSHVYVRELDGSVTDLTPGENLIANFAGWAEDEESFFVASNERNPQFFDVYEVEVDGYERALFYQNDEGYNLSEISDDHRWLILSKTNTTSDGDLYLYDRETGAQRHLTPHEGDASFGALSFTPDNSGLYVTTNEGSEFSRLALMDLEGGETETLLETDWDVMFASFSKNDRYMVVGVNEDGRNAIRMFEMPDMTEIELPDMGGLNVNSVRVSDDETMLAMYAASSRTPGNLYVYELGGPAPLQLTSSLNRAIDDRNLVDGEVARFASYDGLDVPGILYKPHQASPSTPVPAMVWVHGGPGGQSRIGYNGLIQYLVNHGYAVYAINNRGSSGYGKTFFGLDDRKHGDADLDDVVASKQMLIDTGWVDAERIGIIGGSYGGYMTLAALTFRPEEFAVGVDIFGISNWHRTVNNIPPWWGAQKDALEREMGDFDDDEFFRAKSPIFHADQIVRPLMVLQGANDPRVLQVESDEIVEAVRANGVPVEYVLFPDEGHGFRKKENQLDGYRKIREFLDLHLRELPGSRQVPASEAESSP